MFRLFQYSISQFLSSTWISFPLRVLPVTIYARPPTSSQPDVITPSSIRFLSPPCTRARFPCPFWRKNFSKFSPFTSDSPTSWWRDGSVRYLLSSCVSSGYLPGVPLVYSQMFVVSFLQALCFPEGHSWEVPSGFVMSDCQTGGRHLNPTSVPFLAPSLSPEEPHFRDRRSILWSIG